MIKVKGMVFKNWSNGYFWDCEGDKKERDTKSSESELCLCPPPPNSYIDPDPYFDDIWRLGLWEVPINYIFLYFPPTLPLPTYVLCPTWIEGARISRVTLTASHCYSLIACLAHLQAGQGSGLWCFQHFIPKDNDYYSTAFKKCCLNGCVRVTSQERQSGGWEVCWWLYII